MLTFGVDVDSRRETRDRIEGERGQEGRAHRAGAKISAGDGAGHVVDNEAVRGDGEGTLPFACLTPRGIEARLRAAA